MCNDQSSVVGVSRSSRRVDSADYFHGFDEEAPREESEASLDDVAFGEEAVNSERFAHGQPPTDGNEEGCVDRQDVGEIATVVDNHLVPPTARYVQHQNEDEVESQVEAVAQCQVLEQKGRGVVTGLRLPDPERGHVTENPQQG